MKKLKIKTEIGVITTTADKFGCIRFHYTIPNTTIVVSDGDYGDIAADTYGSDPALSPNLKTQVANHHSSAWERNQVMIMEIGHLCDHFGAKFDF